LNSITAGELKVRLDAHDDIILIDVREPYEHEDFNIGGILMPMETIPENITSIPKDKTVVMYCAKGIRSGIVIQRLEAQYGYTNLLNLTGGMYGWKKENGSI
jgi:rhodanese-related sulfurtransferase